MRKFKYATSFARNKNGGLSDDFLTTYENGASVFVSDAGNSKDHQIAVNAEISDDVERVGLYDKFPQLYGITVIRYNFDPGNHEDIRKKINDFMKERKLIWTS